MIGLAISALLIVQSLDGQTQIATLSDEGCEAARCIAEYGMSCEAKVADDAADKAVAEFNAQEQKAWEQANPKKAAFCRAPLIVSVEAIECGPNFNNSISLSESLRRSRHVRSSSATKLARCLK